MSFEPFAIDARIRREEDYLRVVTAVATALEDPFAVLKIVADAADQKAAVAALQQRFGFDVAQAQTVLDLQFRRANARDRSRLLHDIAERTDQLASLRAVAEQQAAVAAHYDARAASYDDSGMHRALAEAVADLIGGPGGPVIDVATGTGLVLRAIGARWPDTPLIGVDVSAAMLDVARAALPHAELVLSDAAALPVRSGHASVVICVTALHLLAEREATFYEWARVLRRGGRLVTATFRDAGAPARPDLPQGFERRHEDFRTPEQVAAALGEHGFRLVSHLDWSHGPDTLLLCELRTTH